MKSTRVINVKSKILEPYVFCGRQQGEKFHYGNPFPMQNERRRDWSCLMFNLWLYGDPQFKEMEAERRIFVIQTLFTLKGKDLGCFCAPKKCHCDTYVKILEGTRPLPTLGNQNASYNTLV